MTGKIIYNCNFSVVFVVLNVSLYEVAFVDLNQESVSCLLRNVDTEPQRFPRVVSL